MPTDPPGVDRELLELCGYIRVHEILVGDGQAVSFNLTNGWNRVALTSEDLGGEGSALGSTKAVTIWAFPDSEGESTFRYDITVQYTGDDLLVVALRSASDGVPWEVRSRQGELVALDLPTPLEMLAAQAAYLSAEIVEDEDPACPSEDEAD